jgi:hypothetical protein
VQVDPIKPKLKAPGTKRLKLTYDQLLSSFAFKFNLRRYNKVFEVPELRVLGQDLEVGQTLNPNPVPYTLNPEP